LAEAHAPVPGVGDRQQLLRHGRTAPLAANVFLADTQRNILPNSIGSNKHLIQLFTRYSPRIDFKNAATKSPLRNCTFAEQFLLESLCQPLGTRVAGTFYMV